MGALIAQQQGQRTPLRGGCALSHPSARESEGLRPSRTPHRGRRCALPGEANWKRDVVTVTGGSTAAPKAVKGPTGP